MRYTAISAVVFASAIFMVPGSHASAKQTNSNILTVHSSTAAQQIDLSPLSLQPRVRLAAADNDRRDAQAAPQKAAAPITPEAPPEQTVTVNPGDNLSTIAAASQQTAQRLYDANSWLDDPNVIQAGQSIRIPSADEQLAARPMPQPAVPAAVPVTPAATKPAYTAPATAGGSVWDQLAACESGGNWAINTGNGFYGGLQFTLATWRGLGGSGLPSEASRDEQIARASALQARSGWGQWPACSAKLGLL